MVLSYSAHCLLSFWCPVASPGFMLLIGIRFLWRKCLISHRNEGGLYHGEKFLWCQADNLSNVLINSWRLLPIRPLWGKWYSSFLLIIYRCLIYTFQSFKFILGAYIVQCHQLSSINGTVDEKKRHTTLIAQKLQTRSHWNHWFPSSNAHYFIFVESFKPHTGLVTHAFFPSILKPL